MIKTPAREQGQEDCIGEQDHKDGTWSAYTLTGEFWGLDYDSDYTSLYIYDTTHTHTNIISKMEKWDT